MKQMNLFETSTCAELPAVTAATHDEILASKRTERRHRALMEEVDALHLIETGDTERETTISGENLTVAAWNLERCLDPEGSAKLLAAYAPDIVLLSEMDSGMARTGQKNTTRALARLLDMHYAYVVEFHELGLGSPIEVDLARDDFNEQGWHGNALLSKAKPEKLALIRLDAHGHWFCENSQADPGQPRVGGRVAIAAVVPTDAGAVCAVSTHLESAGDASIRQSQMDRIIAAVDAFAPGLPVIIGGDLNTGNNLASGDWRDETLFQAAERQGYSWQNNATEMTTRASRLTRFPERKMKLDWFAHRQLTACGAQILPALDERGVALSDHELIVGQFAL